MWFDPSDAEVITDITCSRCPLLTVLHSTGEQTCCLMCNYTNTYYNNIYVFVGLVYKCNSWIFCHMVRFISVYCSAHSFVQPASLFNGFISHLFVKVTPGIVWYLSLSTRISVRDCSILILFPALLFKLVYFIPLSTNQMFPFTVQPQVRSLKSTRPPVCIHRKLWVKLRFKRLDIRSHTIIEPLICLPIWQSLNLSSVLENTCMRRVSWPDDPLRAYEKEFERHNTKIERKGVNSSIWL